MSRPFYDLPGQQRRRQQVYDLLLDHTLDSFDEQGHWIEGLWGSPSGPALRVRLWFALAYLGSGREKAAVIAHAIIKSSEYAFCHFAPMAALQVLVRHGPRLDEAAQAALRRYLQEVLDDFMGGDLDFVGVNDNFPCMSTYTALLGGRLFHRPELYAVGAKRLHQLQALLTRRGVDSEYTSPTYTPIHACALAEIANYVEDEQLHHLALQCEERIWVDLLGHYHPPTAQLAGPYSRAYTVDSTGHTHQARYVLYALLGERLPLNPLHTLFAAQEGQAGEVIHGNLPFQQVSVAWLMGADYHCPTYLVEALADKRYPAVFQATTEFSSSTDALPNPPQRDPTREDETYEYAAGSGCISTYMTEDYALGVASHEFHSGTQTDSFHLLYRRRPVQQQADVATVYARYIINGKKPGQSNSYPQFDTTSNEHLLWDEGRKLGLQHEQAAMMLYKPKIYGHKGVESLKLSLLFPAHYGPVEEIWLGECKLEQPTGQSAEPCPVFIRDGLVYMAFYPLVLTDYGRQAAVRVEQVNDYVMVSFYNYEGPARDFARREFLLTGNGFVAEVRSEREVGSLAAFRAMMQGAKISDTLFTCMHSRWTYLRRTRYEREGLTLECEYSPVSEGIKYVAVNGRVPAAPMLEVTGLEASSLPFM